MIAFRKTFGRRLAPMCAVLLPFGGMPAVLTASSAAAATCTAASPDVDGDRIPDCWETTNGLVVGKRDAGSDRDRDGLSAKTEYTVDKAWSGSGELVEVYNASDDDSNDDGVEDGDDDLDNDGLTNENEKEARTNLLDADTDNDTVLDGADDTDHDGLTNAEEGDSIDEDGDTVGVDDLTDTNEDDVNDANQDFDCDGVSNRNELNAAVANSDHQGVSDAVDDSDQDGINNGTEVTEPADGVLDADSDNDGVEDGDEDADDDGVEDGNDDGQADNDAVDDGDCGAQVEDGQ